MKTKAPSSRKPRARRPAADLWLDRAVFTVSPKAHAALLARLAEPPRPNDRLRRTLQTVPRWE